MTKKVLIIYSASARKDLKHIDKKVAIRIVLKIEENANQSNPLNRAKKLKGVLSGYCRYRIGDYRAIITFDENGRLCVLKVLRIKHRKEIYK